MTRLLEGIGRPWAVAGGVVALLVLGEALATTPLDVDVTAVLAVLLLAVLTGGAVALTGSRPGVALTTAWISYPFWIGAGVPLLVSQLSLVSVAFECGRRGRTPAVVAAGASSLAVPPAILLGLSYTDLARGGPVAEAVFRLIDPISGDTFGGPLPALLLLGASAGLAALTPLVAGLVVRFADRSRDADRRRALAEDARDHSRRDAAAATSEAQSARALARLQEEHAVLARDVHDVVGHSLTVVIAQAEAAQYAADDPAALKATLQGVADTARTSLADVRRVLSATHDGHPDASGSGPGGWDADPLPGMVDGLRSAGLDVQVSEEGTPRPLPPELSTVVHRVTQEMLTNAARHGTAGAPVLVERHWDGDELRLEVRNALRDGSAGETVALTADGASSAPAAGSGLVGMRSRLASVGGRLDVRRREAEGSFTVTAWVPVRPVGGSR